MCIQYRVYYFIVLSYINYLLKKEVGMYQYNRRIMSIYISNLMNNFTRPDPLKQDEVPYSCEVVIETFQDKSSGLSIIEACIVVCSYIIQNISFLPYFVGMVNQSLDFSIILI